MESRLTPVLRACPLMSAAAPIMVEDAVSIVPVDGKMTLSGTASKSPQVLTMVIPCIKEKCQWWSEPGQDCGIVAGLRSLWQTVEPITNTVAVGNEAIAAKLGALSWLSHLEPARGGKSPVERLAVAVESLVDLWSKREKKGGG
jgi:hypothetical protein